MCCNLVYKLVDCWIIVINTVWVHRKTEKITQRSFVTGWPQLDIFVRGNPRRNFKKGCNQSQPSATVFVIVLGLFILPIQRTARYRMPGRRQQQQPPYALYQILYTHKTVSCHSEITTVPNNNWRLAIPQKCIDQLENNHQPATWRNRSLAEPIKDCWIKLPKESPTWSVSQIVSSIVGYRS